jgi:hypothetical protein
MSLWKNTDANTSAPKFAPASGYGISTNGDGLFGNTTSYGTFGVDAAEQAVATKKGAHAGWVLRKPGTGPIVSITANTGSYSPDGNVYLTFSNGGVANTTANAQIVTDGSKQILSITINDPGRYETTPTIGAVANANVALTIVMGGRANRVQTETLVAMGSMTGDGSDDTVFPDA